MVFIGIISTGVSQSEKAKEKVNTWVTELNNDIVSTDKSLALSDIQITQIKAIQFERLKALKKAKKDNLNKAERKKINKEYFQKIFREVLTKKQMKARKATKEKNKKQVD